MIKYNILFPLYYQIHVIFYREFLKFVKLKFYDIIKLITISFYFSSFSLFFFLLLYNFFMLHLNQFYYFWKLSIILCLHLIIKFKVENLVYFINFSLKSWYPFPTCSLLNSLSEAKYLFQEYPQIENILPTLPLSSLTNYSSFLLCLSYKYAFLSPQNTSKTKILFFFSTYVLNKCWLIIS